MRISDWSSDVCSSDLRGARWADRQEHRQVSHRSMKWRVPKRRDTHANQLRRLPTNVPMAPAVERTPPDNPSLPIFFPFKSTHPCSLRLETHRPAAHPVRRFNPRTRRGSAAQEKQLVNVMV